MEKNVYGSIVQQEDIENRRSPIDNNLIDISS